MSLGRALKRAEETRVVADYRGDSVTGDEASALVLQAQEFVEAMLALCESGAGEP
jgi:uncharacterized protein (UPF0332 family)